MEDDSCVLNYIEIVPLDSRCSDADTELRPLKVETEDCAQDDDVGIAKSNVSGSCNEAETSHENVAAECQQSPTDSNNNNACFPFVWHSPSEPESATPTSELQNCTPRTVSAADDDEDDDVLNYLFSRWSSTTFGGTHEVESIPVVDSVRCGDNAVPHPNHAASQSSICEAQTSRGPSHQRDVRQPAFSGTRTGLNMHCQHRNCTPYACSLCTRSFGRLTSLTDHMLTHFDATPFECRWCAKAFATRRSANDHERRVHLSVKSLACGQCGRRFGRRSDCSRHERTHSR